MGKILSAQQIREADQYTIANEPISSIDLMERAAVAFTDRLLTMLEYGDKVLICCGTGNNGGDGLAIGRMLHQCGFKVQLVVVGKSNSGSADFLINLERAKALDLPIEYINEQNAPSVDNYTESNVLIDALFGSGLTRPVEGMYMDMINFMNAHRSTKYAVDIASGLFADHPLPEGAIAFRPNATITFQVPKLAFFLPQYHQYVGDLFVEDIGLDKGFIGNTDSPYSFSEMGEIGALVKKRERYTHKGNYGHVLLIAGNKGKMGAAVLAAKACLRSGVGLLTVYCPEIGYSILQTAVPEAMIITDPENHHLSQVPDLTLYNAIAVGPGIGQHEQTLDFLKALIANADKPMVLDADALNILSNDKDLFAQIPQNSILTPHPKEFERLVGKSSDHFDRLDRQSELSIKYNLNIVVKGANSAMTDRYGNVVFNTTGNPGMATGGTGDVLTGMVVGLLAQRYEPFNALKLAVFLHGKAGDLAAESIGMEATIAIDIVDRIGAAYASVKQK